MRSLIYLILLFFVCANAQVADTAYVAADSSVSESEKELKIQKWHDSFIAKDKAQHFLGSFILAGAIGLAGERFADAGKQESLLAGATISFSLGVLKEGYDSTRPRNRFSWKDLLADAAGVGLALIVFNSK